MSPFRQLARWANEVFPRTSGEKGVFARAWQTAVLWSWVFSFLRLGSFIILLPLLARLPDADFGYYYLLLSIVAVAPLIDFGFAASVERGVSYAMSGATELRSQGLPVGESSGVPNFSLFWKLVYTTRVFYRLLTILLFVVLGGVGTYIVSQSAWATSNPTLAWTAWFIALVNAALEVYSSWWNVVLRGMNQVLTGTRILCFGYGLKLVLSCALLLSGFGIVSIFAAGLVSSAVIRTLSRRKVLQLTPAAPESRLGRTELMTFLRILWPNSWRVGLQLITSYLAALLLMLLCKSRFELAGAGNYGFSLNIAAVIQAIASVWITVKWPAIMQLRSRNDVAGIRKLFWGRLWLETLTFLSLAAVALIGVPLLVKIGVFQKDVLPHPWFAILLVGTFLETQMILWGTLLTTENKVPTLWPIAITNGLNVLLVLIFLETTTIGLGAFVLAPLVSGLLFNYWYWPREGPRNIGSTWSQFMFRLPGVEPERVERKSTASIA